MSLSDDSAFRPWDKFRWQMNPREDLLLEATSVGTERTRLARGYRDQFNTLSCTSLVWRMTGIASRIDFTLLHVLYRG